MGIAAHPVGCAQFGTVEGSSLLDGDLLSFVPKNWKLLLELRSDAKGSEDRLDGDGFGELGAQYQCFIDVMSEIDLERSSVSFVTRLEGFQHQTLLNQ